MSALNDVGNALFVEVTAPSAAERGNDPDGTRAGGGEPEAGVEPASSVYKADALGR